MPDLINRVCVFSEAATSRLDALSGDGRDQDCCFWSSLYVYHSHIVIHEGPKYILLPSFPVLRDTLCHHLNGDSLHIIVPPNLNCC